MNTINHGSGSDIPKPDHLRLDSLLDDPCTREFDYSPLYPFLAFPMNNVDDPFIESRYHRSSHEFERQVIARRFTDVGIGLRSVRTIQRDAKSVLVAISTDRTDAALSLVADVLVS